MARCYRDHKEKQFRVSNLKELRVYRGEKCTQVIRIQGRGKLRGKKCLSSMLKGNARLLPDGRIS